MFPLPILMCFRPLAAVPLSLDPTDDPAIGPPRPPADRVPRVLPYGLRRTVSKFGSLQYQKTVWREA